MYNVSGNGLVVIGGSILYTGVEPLQIHKYFQINASCFALMASSVQYTFALRCSGAGLNVLLGSKTSENALGISEDLNFNYILTNATLIASGGNVGSPYYFTVEAMSNDNSTRAHIGDFLITGF